MTMLGVFAGGVAVARYGLMRAMVIGAFAGPLRNILSIWLSMQGHSLIALFVAIGLDNVAGGFAGTCLIVVHVEPDVGRVHGDAVPRRFPPSMRCRARAIGMQSGRVVEGAARLADAGGVFSGLKALFADQAPDKFATALERSGVTPAALGAGYVVFR